MDMNICSRITNQSAMDYFAHMKRKQLLLNGADCSATEVKIGKSSTKAWVLGAFSATTSKLPGKNFASLGPLLPKTSAATTINPEKPTPETAPVHEAEPSVHFDEYRIHIRSERFKFCLVGKFPQSRPSLEQIKEWAASEWKLEGNCCITLLDQKHVFIRLENEADMIRVWPRNRWFVEGHVMKVFKWTPTFRPTNGEPSLTAVWITFPSLPVVFYEEDLLYPIASKVGKVLGMDDHTRNLTRTTLARVCLEVDLLKEAPRRVWIGVGKGGFWQPIDYEELPSYCTICCMIGHATKLCGRNTANFIADKSEEKVQSYSIKNFDGKGRHYQTYPQINNIVLVQAVKGRADKDLKSRGIANVGEQRRSADGINNQVGSKDDLIGCKLKQNSAGDLIEIQKQIPLLGNKEKEVKFLEDVNQETGDVIEEALQEVQEQDKQQEATRDVDDGDNGIVDADADNNLRKIKEIGLQSRQKKEHNQAKDVHEAENNIKIQRKQSKPIRSYITVSSRMSFWKKRARKAFGGHTAELCRKSSSPLQTVISKSGLIDSVSSSQLRLGANPCRHFSFTDIRRATKNFKGDHLIGEGGFGQVYKGVIDGGTVVAIKRRNPASLHGWSEFRTEIEMLSRLSCRNVVALIGYCKENDEMILVYEFVRRGNLAEHLLLSNAKKSPLSWAQRLKICIGAARGVTYLHSNGVIHRDVKASNIALDNNWEAKLIDFGVCRSADTNGRTHVSTRVVGTMGYADPHYVQTGHLTYQSDVYSFGILLMEVLFGRRVSDLGHSNFDAWRQSCRDEKILQAKIDPGLKENISPRCLKQFAELATKCSSFERSDRPRMGDVLLNLEDILQLQQDHEARMLI